jgi:hypothetical protein
LKRGHSWIIQGLTADRVLDLRASEWRLAYCNEGAARGEYPEKVSKMTVGITKWRLKDVE